MGNPAVFLSIVLLVSGGAAKQVSFDAGADFSAYRSYAWREGTPARNPSMQDRIEDFVDAQLASKGLARVDAEPGLYVTTYVLPDEVGLEELARRNALRFWSGATSVSPADVGAGTLVVDLVDARSGRVVWRGVGSETVTGSFETMTRKVESAVKKMFRRYPPE